MPMINQIANQYLAMDPKFARNLVGSISAKNGYLCFDAHGQVDDAEKPRITAASLGLHGATSHERKPYPFVAGIAVIPVTGTLLHKYAWSDPWATGYNSIVSMFDAANADDDVQGILMMVNSPGGTVAGCFDACDHIYETKGAKPVWAIYDDMACSGAMCIGSAADKRLTTQTAICGSIGVVQAHASYEGMLNDAGVEITLIHSGAHKVDGNPYKNLPDEVYQEFKAECDALKMQFAEKVSRNIGLSIDDVVATEARTYTGEAAIEAGLADELINSHNIISHFQQHLSGTDSTTLRSVTMSEQSQNVAAEPVSTGEEATQVQATAEQAEAVVDHQARCEAIITSEAAEGRKELAHHLAFKTQMSADEALSVLAAAPKQEATASASDATALDAAMAATEQPNISAMAVDSEPSEAAAFVESYQKVTGKGV